MKDCLKKIKKYIFSNIQPKCIIIVALWLEYHTMHSSHLMISPMIMITLKYSIWRSEVFLKVFKILIQKLIILKSLNHLYLNKTQLTLPIQQIMPLPQMKRVQVKRRKKFQFWTLTKLLNLQRVRRVRVKLLQKIRKLAKKEPFQTL